VAFSYVPQCTPYIGWHKEKAIPKAAGNLEQQITNDLKFEEPIEAAFEDKRASSVGAGVSGEAAEPTQPPSPPETPTPAPAWRTVATEYGLNIPDTAKEDDVFRQVFADAVRYHQSGRRAEEFMQSRLPYDSEFQQWLADRQQKATEKARAEDGKPWHAQFWNPPVAYDPLFEAIQANEMGELVAPKDAPPDLLHRFRNYLAFDKQQKLDFFKNPHAYLEPSIKHLARQIFEEEFGRRRMADQEQQFAQSVVSDPKMQERLLVRDAVGKPIGYTPWGTEYQRHLQQAFQWGLPTQAQHAYATAMADSWERGQPGQTPQKQNGKPKTKREQSNDNWYGQREPQHAGQIEGAAETPTPASSRMNGDKIDPRQLLFAAVKDFTDQDFHNYAHSVGRG